MNTRNLLFAGAAMAGLALPVFLRAAESVSALTIHTAIEVEFPTEKGKVYQLQGSSNLLDWSSIGDSVFGSGRPVNRIFSTRNGDEVLFQSYRLDTSDAPAGGFAPWSLAGLQIQLDDKPGADRVNFTSETEGSASEGGSDAFTYEFTRVDLNTVTADLKRSADRHDLLTLTFTAADRGTWLREEFRKGKLKDRDLGVFVVGQPVANGTNSVPVDPAAPSPESIAGKVFVFQDGAHPDRLEFKTASGGVETGDDVNDDELNLFSYTYAVTGDQAAHLVVTFKPGRYDEYDLTFASAAQGSFVRREYRDGRLKDTDRGSFSEVVSTGGGNGSGGTTNPPAGSGEKPASTLNGLTYTVREGEHADTLVFNSETTGVETGDDVSDDEANTFTYTYVSTGDTTAQVVLRFKADRWDEYDLTFTEGNSGTFVRREFKKGVLDDTDTGSFSGAATVKP